MCSSFFFFFFFQAEDGIRDLTVTGVQTCALPISFWHGVDPAHPLHGVASAAPARERLHAVYRATDALVGELIAACPDATVVAFAMNGMGPNRSDVASMLLLSELLYRDAFGRPLLRVP